MANDIRVAQGSLTDNKYTNLVLEIFHAVGVTYGVTTGSFHWNVGGPFEKWVSKIEEELILFIGGMELSAPGAIAGLFRNAKKFDKIVIAIPTDHAAQSAIENLPLGTAILTGGLNIVSVKHGIKNTALAIAQLVAIKKPEIRANLDKWYEQMANEKALISEMILDKNGLIPKEEEE